MHPGGYISTFYRAAQQLRRPCIISPVTVLNLSGRGAQSEAEYSIIKSLFRDCIWSIESVDLQAMFSSSTINRKGTLLIKSFAIKVLIAASLHCARNTVAATLRRADNCVLQWPLPDEMLDRQLAERFFPSAPGKPAYMASLPAEGDGNQRSSGDYGGQIQEGFYDSVFPV